MPGSKKDKKNGKENGGVVAAVTKAAPKFTNGNGVKALSTSPSSPQIQSPEINAAAASHDIPSVSPNLDAISTASFATSNSPNTREWTKGLAAGMAGSPSNLISLGTSPTTAPSSYEDARGLNSGWSSPRPPAPVPAPYHLHSVSPPIATRRPLSYQMDGRSSPNKSSPPDIHSQATGPNPGTRRSSMHSHYAQMRGMATPPLPHQPQRHFYEAPDLDFDVQPQSGRKPGSDGYYFGFDVLPSPDLDHVPGKGNVILAGYEGGLEVHGVSKKGLTRLAGLKGLRGGVYHAKILAWTSGSDSDPLVALVIHGANLSAPTPTPGINVEGDYDAVSAERSEALMHPSSDVASRDGASTRASLGCVESYQTTVEMYSLKTGKFVTSLLEAPKQPLNIPITSPIFKAPPPTGAFHIRAHSGTVVVSSGVTGECWVYRQVPLPHPSYGVLFRCLGKLWTTLQQPLKGDSSQEIERGRVVSPPRPRPQSAILSMTDRWIAYCPAAPSSALSLRALVTVDAQGKAPGFNSVTSPQLPPVNADLDLPLSESVVNKIMRDATQEIIQGARWVGKQGLQAWHNYWNPQQVPTPRSPTSTTQPWAGNAARQESQFPPTHGAAATSSTPKEPGLVSIVDIESMGFFTSVHPVVTFAVPHGCSFLSFSPSASSLFTASSKGDVQTIWDLMRVKNTKSSPVQSSALPISGGPRVRQIAQFSRMTVARVIDVAWTKPNGERLAMVTERGTVHLLDLPSSAFTWPPPRRRTPQQDAKRVAEGPTSAVTIASNALNTVRGAALPLINRPRRSSSNVPQLTGSGLGDYATHGGKVLAASISHSLGKTGYAINQLRHTGENRVSLPNSHSVPGSSCVVWISGKKDHLLFVLGDGLSRSFPNKTRKTTAGGDRRAPRLSRYKDFRHPHLPDDKIAPVVKAIVDPDEYSDMFDKDSDPGNTTVLDQRPRPQSYNLGAESSIPQAEIESSAPYQPFHTDRRVGLYELYSEPPSLAPQSDSDAISALLATTSLSDSVRAPSPRRKQSKKAKASTPEQLDADEQSPYADTSASWSFGQTIDATQLDVGLPLLSEEDTFNIPSEETRALPQSAMERTLVRTADEDQIVVTTRRRRGAARAGGQDDDGFFEDDCEVLDFADQRV